ncbi:acyltransferase family protein [Pectobacterium brasiliense]|uniref:Acyltransferase n=1 Tax=Pectobacterium brasiliense TaxID=180957 RepID=A0A3S0Y5V2_9GAMM|nr:MULTISPECIES: acyltransferase [Pectobacterium]GKW30268.1 acyltransferase [Pectobacterium carotovorum subsp. carotovorum]MBN3049179.1 acyltransferase [Pectobacterium brasiliense]MBN3077888.1 acyltransferase [Pectobacterium brasiliense]MBN3086801.1 acyltransferase [Pectobacterium brasiliense]MBN3089994.1 acyltransferase [Pectobacterium brasiliense]
MENPSIQNGLNNNQLHGLTIFRFIAAFYVFIFHCQIRYPLDVPNFVTRALNNGAIGMSFFFVLSGFVMAWSARNGIRSDYLRARISRIYPAYILMGIISLPFLFDIENEKLIPSLVLYFSGMQSWIPDSFSSWHFIGSWSVSTELFFYMVFPLILPLINKNPKSSLLIAYVITSLIIPFSMVFSGSSNMPYFYISPIHRLPEFIIGIALGVMYTNGFKLTMKRYQLLLAAFSLLILLFVSPISNDGYMKRNFATVLATASLVFVFACSKVEMNVFTRPFIWLGKISYSFYLMQIPIILFFLKYPSVFLGMENYQVWVVFGALNLILAAVSYYFVEEKFIIKIKKKSFA